jgi:hypothetical protein
MPVRQSLVSEVGDARNFRLMNDLDEIIQRIGNAKVVMLGKASHGSGTVRQK